MTTRLCAVKSKLARPDNIKVGRQGGGGRGDEETGLLEQSVQAILNKVCPRQLRGLAVLLITSDLTATFSS